jgi:choline kinase
MSEVKRNVARISKLKKDHVDVIIPAAGECKGMRFNAPKSVLPINGSETILDRQVGLVKEQVNYRNIVLVVGFKPEFFNNLPVGVTKVENPDYKTTNVVNSLKIGSQVINKPKKLLIVYGDLFFKKPIDIRPMIQGGKSSILINKSKYVEDSEVGCNIIDGNLKYMIWSFQNKWGQMLYLEGKELDIFLDLINQERTKKYFLFEIVNKVIDLGGTIKSYETEQTMFDIDSYKDLNKAKELLKNESSGNSS